MLKTLSLSFLDLLETLGLVTCFLFALPLVLVRGFDGSLRLLWYLRFLFDKGLVAPALRAEFDFRLGNHDRAAAMLTEVLDDLERNNTGNGERRGTFFRFHIDLYNRLLKYHLRGGRIESGTQTVIRAYQKLGVPCLPDYPEFDIKTAHVVKAGIAAGKLLEEGGLATLLVRPGEEPIIARRRISRPQRKREGAIRSPGAKIIPFPHVQKNLT